MILCFFHSISFKLTISFTFSVAKSNNKYCDFIYFFKTSKEKIKSFISSNLLEYILTPTPSFIPRNFVAGLFAITHGEYCISCFIKNFGRFVSNGWANIIERKYSKNLSSVGHLCFSIFNGLDKQIFWK